MNAPKGYREDEWFDGIARAVANTTTRRAAVKSAVFGLAAFTFDKIGIKSAWAAATCQCFGQTYTPTSNTCCSSVGPTQKYPILVDPISCPNRVAHLGRKCPPPNGCGGEGGFAAPNSYGSANFLTACNAHDCCYDTCMTDKVNNCDANLRAGLHAACAAAYPISDPISYLQRHACDDVAETYHAFVQNFGQGHYNASQQYACDCCTAQPTGCDCPSPACFVGELKGGGTACMHTVGQGYCKDGCAPGQVCWHYFSAFAGLYIDYCQDLCPY